MKPVACQNMCKRKRGIEDMPIISMFYGIIIRMYFLDNQRHAVPHIPMHGTPVPRHRSGLMTVKYWPGELPRKQLRLV
jgi:hypothetical protein